MTDFLLELLSEEIPARMQAKARPDLARLFAAELAAAGLAASAIATYSTPRRLALIARGLPDETAPVREERRGPRADAPDQAIAGFLGSTGLTRDQLEAREDKKGAFLYAILESPACPTRDILAEAIPRIVRDFPWPKSMRWGSGRLRWVRPLQGVVALFGGEVVSFEIGGAEASPAKVGTGFASGDATTKIMSGATTVGHRFHHPGPITIGGADDYAEKLRACHVVLDHEERAAIIRDRADGLAAEAGLALVEDEALVTENAALTEWPVPLLGSFDETFLDLPPEVITLTMRTNQKYFALKNPPRNGEGDHSAQPDGGGVASEASSNASLSSHFICVANIDASDDGAAIIAGNRKVLAARLADAKFFWEQDLKTPLADHAKKLDQIVFHEKLGTVADKVERLAKLARWLVEEGIVKSSPAFAGEGDHAQHGGGAAGEAGGLTPAAPPPSADAAGPPPRDKLGEDLATLAETAARFCKADLVTQMVGEFPELQGVIGGHYARAEGLDPRIAAAIRDHYKPVGQGDEVPTEPVTVAVALADKLDTLVGFFGFGLLPSGSRDPFALRRAALGVIAIILKIEIRVSLSHCLFRALAWIVWKHAGQTYTHERKSFEEALAKSMIPDNYHKEIVKFVLNSEMFPSDPERLPEVSADLATFERAMPLLLDFFADRLKVQQREAGVRHDLIDAVFALGGEDDLVRLLARVRALQVFVGTDEGANLLTGYKRATNILKREGWGQSQTAAADIPKPAHPELVEGSSPTLRQAQGERVLDAREKQKPLSYTPEKEETALIAALDSAEPAAADAIEAEDFAGAMAALASLRAPIDGFFDEVTVNDPDPIKRESRLALLARIRDAIHGVADFSKIEG